MAERKRLRMLDEADLQLQLLQAAPDSPAHPLAVAATLWLLAKVVADGQPTPQITCNPTGDVEVNWLVNGYCGGLLVGTDGFQLWAEDPRGRDIFSHESSASRSDPERQAYLLQMRRWLVDLGKKIPTDVQPRGTIQA